MTTGKSAGELADLTDLWVDTSSGVIGTFKDGTRRIIKCDELRAALTRSPSRGLGMREINETSRDWSICNAVDAYRALRNEGDERTLSDFLEEKGLRITPALSQPAAQRTPQASEEPS